MSPEENATIHHAASVLSPNTNFVLFNSIMSGFFIFICGFSGPLRDFLIWVGNITPVPPFKPKNAFASCLKMLAKMVANLFCGLEFIFF